MYDLGFRTPIVLCWPGRVPAGAVRDEIVSAVDLFPTLLDYAGAAPVADRPGHSLRRLLEDSGDDGDGDSAAWPREVAIGHMPWFRGEGGYEGGHEGSFQQTGAFFLRDPTWRYIWYPATGKDELYNLANDPHEERDVSAQEKRLALRFRKQIIEWRRAMTS